MVNIDDLASEVAAEFFVQHLHVAGEDDEVSFLLAEDLLHLAVGCMLGLRRHRDEVEGDAVGFDDFAVVFVIGDYARHDEREILGDVAGE